MSKEQCVHCQLLIILVATHNVQTRGHMVARWRWSPRESFSRSGCCLLFTSVPRSKPLECTMLCHIPQDPVPIYWANIAVLAACYGYGFTIGKPDGGNLGPEKKQPKWLKFIYKVRLLHSISALHVISSFFNTFSFNFSQCRWVMSARIFNRSFLFVHYSHCRQRGISRNHAEDRHLCLFANCGKLLLDFTAVHIALESYLSLTGLLQNVDAMIHLRVSTMIIALW